MTATPINAGLVVGAANVRADDGREQLAVTNPANQEVIGYAPVADAGLVDEAVTLAAQAFPNGRRPPPPNARAISSPSRRGSGTTGTSWPEP